MALFTSTEFNSLNDLFLDQLQDVYDAEHRMAGVLPKMAETATAMPLATAFRDHHQETERQIERLERVFELLGEKPARKSCDAMKGLISEGDEVLQAKGSPEVIDAALICAAQRVEHYEMAAYGCLRNIASRLGLTEARELLQETLNEEGEADHKLTSIADSYINTQAAKA